MLAFILLIFTVLVWGLTIAILGQAVYAIHPFYFALIKFLPSSIALITTLWYTEGKKAFTINKQFILASFIGTLSFMGFNVFVFFGVKFTSTVNTSILIACLPIITIAFSLLYFKQKFNLITLFVIVGATITVLYLTLQGNLLAIYNLFTLGSFAGNVIILCGLVLAVLSSVFVHKFSNYSALKYTTITVTSGVMFAIVLIIIFSIAGKMPAFNFTFAKTMWLKLLFVAVFGGAIAQYTFIKGIKLIGLGNAVAFTTLQPVVVIVYNYIYKIPVKNYELTASAIIILLLFVLVYDIKRKEKLNTKI